MVDPSLAYGFPLTRRAQNHNAACSNREDAMLEQAREGRRGHLLLQ
jgi:hypothetical protein